MSKEIESIIAEMKDTLSGSPWYGKPVLGLLNEIDPSLVHERPAEGSHSMIDLLYHMITWVEFALHRIQKDLEMDNSQVGALDWRNTDPGTHTWNNGISQFTAATNRIIELLQHADERLLEEQVDFRDYNFRHLLHGLTQHTIYHLGQIAYAHKLLSARSGKPA